MRNVFLVSYDVANPKRLRQTYKKMCGFGDPMHYSVFRCELTPTERQLLKEALWKILNWEHDSHIPGEDGLSRRDRKSTPNRSNPGPKKRLDPYIRWGCQMPSLARIFHELSAARPQVFLWPRPTTQFDPQRIDNTLPVELLGFLAREPLATARDEIHEICGLGHPHSFLAYL